MRISVEKNDPGYAAYQRAKAEGYDFVVELNGVRVSGTMADSGTGEVKVPVLDARGMIQIDPNKPDEIWHEIRRGRVTIIRRWKAKQP